MILGLAVALSILGVQSSTPERIRVEAGLTAWKAVELRTGRVLWRLSASEIAAPAVELAAGSFILRRTLSDAMVCLSRSGHVRWSIPKMPAAEDPDPLVNCGPRLAACVGNFIWPASRSKEDYAD